MRRRMTLLAGLFVLGSLVGLGSAWAGEGYHESEKKAEMKKAEMKGDVKDETERAETAGRILKELTSAEDKTIPKELLENAEGIAVIPHVVKGAMGVGGRYGKGLVSSRMEDGSWSPPAYVHLGGASFGVQIGVQSTDLVLVFMDEKGLEQLMEDKIEFGATASATAGPVGRHVEAGVNITLDSGIYSYSHSKGLFAGIALEGAVLTLDSGANTDVYGEKVEPENILNGDGVEQAEATKPFRVALSKHIPAYIEGS